MYTYTRCIRASLCAIIVQYSSSTRTTQRPRTNFDAVRGIANSLAGTRNFNRGRRPCLPAASSVRPTECAQRDFDSQAYEIRSHTHRDRARRRVQPRTHQLAASRRVCGARFRQAVAADSIVDPPAGLLMHLRSQEAPQYLALQKTKYVRSHIEVARASGCSHAHINSPRPTECAQRDFDSQAPLLRFSTPPPGMLMQLRLQETPHPAPRTTKNEIRSHPHRDRARRRVQPRTHQLAASHRVCAARFRQSGAPASTFDPAGHANAVAAAGGAPPSPSHYKKRNTFPPTSRSRAPAGAATHTSTRRVPPSVRSAISTARGRAVAINIAILQYECNTYDYYRTRVHLANTCSPRPPVT